ncbi:oligosaccharide flippase family protein [Ensifer adhaerens]|uniref:oligosaccharide flippase family protein n=1 Tax=Ensifer adhaerens TaxID=106592 RepID=UPI00128F8166|nr:oligosaccharide flippase family protein [Ensifer adhaerens]
MNDRSVGQPNQSLDEDGASARNLKTGGSIMAGGAWVIAAKAIAQVTQLCTFFVAARLLAPTEFGLFAFISAIAILCVVLAEGGWAEFIMKSGDDRDRFDQVATIALLSGLFFTMLGLGASAVLYLWTERYWESALLALFSCWMLPAAVSTVYDGTLVVRGQLRQQAGIRIVAEVVGVGATITGLVLGWHAAALVVGRIAIQLMVLMGSARIVGWRPRLSITRSVVKDVIEFSRHIVANRIIVFFSSYSGTLAVGSFLGVTEAGYYRAAERIVSAISEFLGEPTRALGWIVFRRARDRQAEHQDNSVAEASGRFLTVLLVVASPIYLGLMQVSDALVYFVLGEQWMPAALIVSVLCLKQLLLLPGYITEPLLSVMGNVSKRLPVTLLNVFVSLSLIVALAPFGLLPLAVGQCVSAAFAVTTSVRLQIRFGGVDWRSVMKNIAILIAPAASAMVAVVVVLRGKLEVPSIPLMSTFLLQVGIGAAVYCSIFLLLARWTGRVKLARQGELSL